MNYDPKNIPNELNEILTEGRFGFEVTQSRVLVLTLLVFLDQEYSKVKRSNINMHRIQPQIAKSILKIGVKP